MQAREEGEDGGAAGGEGCEGEGSALDGQTGWERGRTGIWLYEVLEDRLELGGPLEGLVLLGDHAAPSRGGEASRDRTRLVRACRACA